MHKFACSCVYLPTHMSKKTGIWDRHVFIYDIDVCACLYVHNICIYIYTHTRTHTYIHTKSKHKDLLAGVSVCLHNVRDKQKKSDRHTPLHSSNLLRYICFPCTHAIFCIRTLTSRQTQSQSIINLFGRLLHVFLVLRGHTVAFPNMHACVRRCMCVCYYIYIYIYIYTHTHTHICVCMSTYTGICMYVRVHTYVHKYMLLHACAYVHTKLCVCIRVCIRTYTSICMCMCVHHDGPVGHFKGYCLVWFRCYQDVLVFPIHWFDFLLPCRHKAMTRLHVCVCVCMCARACVRVCVYNYFIIQRLSFVLNTEMW